MKTRVMRGISAVLGAFQVRPWLPYVLGAVMALPFGLRAKRNTRSQVRVGRRNDGRDAGARRAAMGSLPPIHPPARGSIVGLCAE